MSDFDDFRDEDEGRTNHSAANYSVLPTASCKDNSDSYIPGEPPLEWSVLMASALARRTKYLNEGSLNIMECPPAAVED